MSYDRKIDQLCPHLIAREVAIIGTDRRTITPAHFIASMGSIRVTLNRQVNVPSYGNLTPAKTFGSTAGPFTVKTGVNDILSIQVGASAIQTIKIPPGTNLSTSRLADILTSKFSGLNFFEVNGHITVQSSEVGMGARFFIYPTSTLAGTLGVLTNQEFRGQKVAPGWSLVSVHRTLSDRPLRVIVLDDPLKSYQDVTEINYVTIRQECRRCGSLAVENDWRYTKSGDVVEVVDEAILIQELLKIFYTVKGSNIFNPWYGSDLIEAIGKKLSAGDATQNFIISDVQRTFQRWQSIKRQQEEDVGQTVSDREYPYRLVSVNLTPSDQDPTVVLVRAKVQNRAGGVLDIQRGVRIPPPQDLLGETAQQGIIRQSLNNFVLTG